MMQKTIIDRKARCAFTLTESAIVLGIVGVVLGAVWVGAGSVWGGYRSNKVMQEIMSVAQNMRDHFGPMGRLLNCSVNYTGFVDDDDRRLIPIDMRSVPNTEGRAINHSLAVRTGDANAGSFLVRCNNSNTSFRIRARDLKKEHCMQILMKFPVLSQEMGVTRMAGPSGNTVVNARNIIAPATITLPMTAQVAQSWCSTTSNEVSFDFTLLN